MRLEFGFGNGNDNEHLPYNIPYNCVTYLGTHDNEPINEWIRNCGPEEYRFAKDIACVDDSLIDFNWRLHDVVDLLADDHPGTGSAWSLPGLQDEQAQHLGQQLEMASEKRTT